MILKYRKGFGSIPNSFLLVVYIILPRYKYEVVLKV